MMSISSFGKKVRITAPDKRKLKNGLTPMECDKKIPSRLNKGNNDLTGQVGQADTDGKIILFPESPNS